MTPKTIHYCWFGRNPLPKSAIKCIDSWRFFFPDYEIKEWNEDNFDVNRIPYTKDAYEAKKYAFVSDYARFWILFHYGGVYFDTDVEVVKRMDDLIENGAFMGWETASNTGEHMIAPGLGLAAPKEFPLYKEILEGFEKLHFYDADGNMNRYTMIPMVTDILKRHGLVKNGRTQTIANTTIFASDYFCPMDTLTGRISFTENTRSIHWYSMSWLNKRQQWKLKVGRLLRKYIIRK